jgi:hypothetical protein
MVSGYSFKTSQYGLAVDNIARFEVVLPNGTIANVTSMDEDLWFGLRVSGKARYRLAWLNKGLQLQGGMNNFVCYQFEAIVHFLGFNRL